VSAVAIKRADCAYTCGIVCYTQDDLDAAVGQGYGYYQDDEQVGTSSSPLFVSCLSIYPLIHPLHRNPELDKRPLTSQNTGDNSYPHQYNNYEGFEFPDEGPWYEFPILSSDEVYAGGSPGADRVVFNADGKFQDAITHTGASGNNFVECESS